MECGQIKRADSDQHNKFMGDLGGIFRIVHCSIQGRKKESVKTCLFSLELWYNGFNSVEEKSSRRSSKESGNRGLKVSSIHNLVKTTSELSPRRVSVFRVKELRSNLGGTTLTRPMREESFFILWKGCLKWKK